MAYVLQKIYDGYVYFFYDIKGLVMLNLIWKWWQISFFFLFGLKDERSENFFLIQNPPIPIALILIGYVLLIKWGPGYMKERKPFDLKYTMMFYNFLQVILNSYVSLMVRVKKDNNNLEWFYKISIFRQYIEF